MNLHYLFRCAAGAPEPDPYENTRSVRSLKPLGAFACPNLSSCAIFGTARLPRSMGWPTCPDDPDLEIARRPQALRESPRTAAGDVPPVVRSGAADRERAASPL